MEPAPIINIAILDDHQIIVDGLYLLLKSEPNIKVMYRGTKADDFMMYLDHSPDTIDVLILDLIMPDIDGYEMALLLEERYPGIRIIILSMNREVDLVYNIIEKTEIKGYLPKSTNKDVLIAAINTVYRHTVYIHPDILDELKDYKVKVYEKESLMLSPREIEIVNLICRGLSNKEIAASLYLSEHTVATHRKKIYKKTNSHNTAMLIETAMRLNILQS